MGQESQARRLGCFRLRLVCYLWNLWKKPPRVKLKTRLAGTLFGGQGVFYQNDEGYKSNPCQNNDRVVTLDCDIATLWVALDIGLWHWTLNCDIVGNNWQPQTEQPGQYLTPDATSNPTTLHWIVSEAPGAFNGGVRSVFLLLLARKGVLQGRVYDMSRCLSMFSNQTVPLCVFRESKEHFGF